MNYCQTCGKKMYIERKSKKFCDSTCRARYHREQTNDLHRELRSIVVQTIQLRQTYFKDDVSPDMQVEALENIELVQHELNKILAYIGTVESEQANTWYQCQNCGQRTFGKVDSCDFCNENDFKRIVV